MSQAEIQRFASAVQAEPALAEAYVNASSLAEVAARLRTDGYDVTDGELAECLRHGEQLSEDDLDRVTGGVVVSFGTMVGATVLVGALTVAGVVGMTGGVIYRIVQDVKAKK